MAGSKACSECKHFFGIDLDMVKCNRSNFNATQKEFDEYITLLREADWEYNYAEGEPYYEGMRSVKKAEWKRIKLISRFPDRADEINLLWEARGKV